MCAPPVFARCTSDMLYSPNIPLSLMYRTHIKLLPSDLFWHEKTVMQTASAAVEDWQYVLLHERPQTARALFLDVVETHAM